MSGSRQEAGQSANLFALFDCLIDPESGAYLSEDYSFCLRWPTPAPMNSLATTARGSWERRD
jgi:hypothetical protein